LAARNHSVSALPPSLAPRGLSRVQSAEYVGVGVSKFDELVRDGRMPQPKQVDGRTIWDRLELDEAFNSLEQKSAPTKPNPWEGF
jgi:predicted DNA-binding transcriptional regulator AlpA